MDKNNKKPVSETEDILFKLATHFPTSEVSWRTQRVFQSYKDKKWYALALAYLSVRQVQDRLTEVMGHNWQCKHTVYGSKTVCSLGLKLDGEWIWRSDGAGDTNFEADKGALSDSLKRAGVAWGIGRYLYDLKNTYVPCDVTDQGKFKKFSVDPWEIVRKNQSDFN
jgi:hypothetical protein